MESGNNGDVLTPTIMNASSHPATLTWITSNATWVSTGHTYDLSGPVVVGETTYNGTGGTRTWALNNNNQHRYIRGSWNASPSKMTVAFFFTTGATSGGYIDYDTVNLMGASGIFTVMQTTTTMAGGPYVRPIARTPRATAPAGLLSQSSAEKRIGSM